VPRAGGPTRTVNVTVPRPAAGTGPGVAVAALPGLAGPGPGRRRAASQKQNSLTVRQGFKSEPDNDSESRISHWHAARSRRIYSDWETLKLECRTQAGS
jgi:hypothetical protein